MIDEIDIQNFQSHKNTQLKLHSGVNLIIGESDSGKTAILRALKWLITNRPLGDSYRSDWGGSTSVCVRFDDCEITRRKDSSDEYKLKKYDGSDELSITAFGTAVPDEIQQALNFDEVNYQGQMDSSYLLSNNPGEVARHFNQIANLEKIDSSLKNVERWTRQLTQDKRSVEQEIQRYDNDLESYDGLDEAEELLNKIEKLDKTRQLLNNDIKKLSNLIASVEQIIQSLAEYPDTTQLEQQLESVLNEKQKRKQTYSSYKNLQTLINKYFTVNKAIKDKKEACKGEETVNVLIGLYESKKQIKQKQHKLNALVRSHNDISLAVINKENDLKEIEKKWHEVMPEKCPLCGNYAQ